MSVYGWGKSWSQTGLGSKTRRQSTTGFNLLIFPHCWWIRLQSARIAICHLLPETAQLPVISLPHHCLIILFVSRTKKMDGGHESSSRLEAITPEIYYLIVKFLSEGPCRRSAEILRDEVERHQLMPKRIDWKGRSHHRSLEDVERNHPHIRPDHLQQILSRMGSLLDTSIPPSVQGVASILGAGRQSLLRSSSQACEKQITSTFLTSLINGAPPLPPVQRRAKHPFNIINVLTARERIGRLSHLQTVPTAIFQRFMGPPATLRPFIMCLLRLLWPDRILCIYSKYP